MSELYPSIAQCAIVATALKVLLFPAYKSTDFEVHRNWLALTHSLPVKEWYYEQTSEWTLDYPPFFAYFEWLLSQFASYVDPMLLNVKALGYDSWRTVYFQRTSVIITELVLVYALHLYVKTSRSKSTAHAAALSVLLSPGLFIIDHIHFQYNGFMYGILVLSMVLARNNSTLLISGLLFAALLCFKHIYLYLAPAYFVYLLRAYCLGDRATFPYFNIRFFNCVKLGVGIIAIFASAFGPFGLWGQMEQVFRRLFPFSRGLCHAYWAPNVWAMYSFVDRVLIYAAPRLGLTVDPEAVNSVTRGLVGDTSFAVLPDVVPLTCFLLTLGSQIPVLLRLLYKPNWETFVGAITLCGYSSFLFGWHVHEKAILLVIIPFSLVALHDRRFFGAFRPLAVAGHVSLFPLLFTAAEFPVKTVYTIFWLVLFLLAFDRLAPASPQPRIFLLDRFSFLYIALSIPLIAYCSLVHGLVFGSRLEFLPLMFTSSYSAIGVVGSWVLYKRKPVKLEPLPKSIDDNTEVWIIHETGEVFVDYEKFLNRRDFYEQKKFTCESTGHTGFTFFEARESEVRSTPVLEKGSLIVTTPQSESSKEINSILPEALRSRVLEHVQFQTTARMDDLVNDVFDHFKEQFLVNDRVSIECENVRRYGRITEMNDTSRLHSGFLAQSMDDSVRSYSYVVTLDDNDEKIIKYRASELQRDRKVYSKIIFKQYLRHTTTRDPWVGAPWMVKEHLAKRYGLPLVMPDRKTREAMLARRRAANANLQNGVSPPAQQAQPQPTNGNVPHLNGNRPPIQTNGQAQATFVNFAANPQFQGDPRQQSHVLPPHMRELPPGFVPCGPPPIPYVAAPPFFNDTPPSFLNTPPPNLNVVPPHFILQQHQQHQQQQQQYQHQANLHPHPHFQTSFPHNQGPRPANFPPPQQIPQPTRLLEPIKYPMEDLEIRQPRVEPVRPSFKFFSDDVPDGMEEPKDEKKTGIMMKSIGPLLCAWDTLNVHDGIYMLDSFTFDDFVDAMRFADEEVDCELFVEIHCSILKQIVSESGKLQTSLPKLAEAEESDDESSDEESSPTPEPEPPVRTTRSSLRKSEAQQLVRPHTPTPEPPKVLHSAEKFLDDFDWVEQCKIRNFREGGWQSIVVGLLHRLSSDPKQEEGCNKILAQLVPANEEPTMESIASNYVQLDVNLRISALDLLLSLTIATEAFREELGKSGLEMTRLRKEKIDYQRKRKELADELCRLDLDRKIHLPANTPASPIAPKEEMDIDASMTSVASETNDAADVVEGAEDSVATKSRLRQSNKNKRKAAAEEARKEKAKKAKQEAEKTKKQKEWEKLLDSIEKKKAELRECEAQINELDDDLRETLVHRSKVLGKDRFLNKYYWFEHNGMPFGGVPTSSTAEYGYANGRLWVQGPDEYELQGSLEEPAVSQDRKRFGFDIPQRKKREEGDTHLTKSTEWAYYDEPEDLDQLLAWLDERGVREKALRKELHAFREKIAEYMVIMKKHLAEPEKTEEEDEEETTSRISTRNKSYVDKEAAKDRCLLWTNSIMREDYGYSHFEEYEPPKKGKAKTVKAAKGKAKR
ncbi:ALG6, ALG8 glycosyltransferase family-domain-containing protein [Phaeosphaeria sp. MPI-PUGE-AT-0046c]|nr:ALG6, ALG8 glycosyltransferase family-domain-containing protein [Phaeosphaeria sp. MPI-PUGE-AT-0046c]